MKITQISEHIWSLKIWMLIPIHVWIVKDEDGVTLVDAGIPFMAKGIQQFIETLNAGPLKRVMLTHGHGDHTGAILKILNVTQVPIFAHRIEIPYIEGELPYPRRKKAAISIPKQITQALPETNQGVLQTMGGLTPYLTPGHSPGHVVYYHQQDQVLLAGDLFTAKKGELRKPMAMFTADMTEAIRSSSIVREIKPLRLEVCHGSSVLQPANQLDTYLKS
ncbi:MBL fold metallo-hydrolase [Paenibacillus crassostreae]|uniref:Hydrolase glyoxylase n=2 Tax=Paenibacillus crassostreae TaxID=1763538 RepID=A0A167FTC8_9BACL|nr:MBL fold metallo-hydrolase [Paenibacillus crassostreae]AOZ94085.1 MBL fold metallo-hydrolase [Paenibacillus crassostreae]OAB76879.1 hydrolase glyoxylase [Paenibacillus crassostreae]